MSQKIIGVLGGMGPAATVDLFQNIVHRTKAETDQEHVHMIIINDPFIPDRTKYIQGVGETPIPRMIENLLTLQKSGATEVIIPCMTAHTFIEKLQENISIPIINGIELIQSYIDNNHYLEEVGLLATNGSIESNVFQQNMKKQLIIPEPNQQKELMQVIYGENGIKAGNINEKLVNKLKDIVDTLKKKNVNAIISGCTELSLIMNERNMSLPIIDPLVLLAEEAIRISKAR